MIGVLKRIKDHEDEVDGKRVHEAKGERPMKKSVIVTVAAAVALVTTLCGCASLLGGGGPSDAELVAAALAGWKTGMEAQDIDKMMAQISEDFQGQNGGKPELKALLEGAIDQFYLDGAEVDIDVAETTIEGETASVMGIGLETDMGEATMDMELKKEADGAWRIIAIEFIM